MGRIWFVVTAVIVRWGTVDFLLRTVLLGSGFEVGRSVRRMRRSVLVVVWLVLMKRKFGVYGCIVYKLLNANISVSPSKGCQGV